MDKITSIIATVCSFQVDGDDNEHFNAHLHQNLCANLKSCRAYSHVRKRNVPAHGRTTTARSHRCHCQLDIIQTAGRENA